MSGDGGGGWKAPTAVIGILTLLVAIVAYVWPRAASTEEASPPLPQTTYAQTTAPRDEPAPPASTEPLPEPSDDEATEAPETQDPTNEIVEVAISLRESSRVGPDEFEAGNSPLIDVSVIGETGLLDEGCYVTWKMYRGSKLILSGRLPECQTFFNPAELPGRDYDDLPAGPYRINASVKTDDGQTAKGQYKFSAVEMNW